MLKKLLFTGTLLMLPIVSNAALLLNISSDVGGGTLWEFSGSTVAVGNGQFSTDNAVSEGQSWSNLPFDLTNVNDFDAVVSSGAASLTVGGETRSIQSVYIDDDSTGSIGADEFGVDVTGTSFTFIDGDVISWTGAVVIDTISISDFLVSSFSVTDFVPGSSEVALDVFIGTPASSVASPTVPALFALGLIGLVSSRRKT